ncbi:hypothetical protein ABLU80_23425 [Klebsiella sp. CN_Kp104]|uniref:hypothetical protein n=1 Tax=Klebsiella sp. CN_Kp104 TaxID=3153423 RepID=UPI0032B3AAA8
MTEINRLIASLKRRAAHAKDFGDDVTFVKLEDLDVLVEALEKAQQVDEELCKLLPPGVEYMDPPDGGDVTPLEGVRRMVADYRQRIAELESRTVTVKLPDCDLAAVQHMSGGSKDYCNGFVDGTQNAIRAMRAAGVDVREAE